MSIVRFSKFRICLWISILILGSLTFWQWRSRTAYQNAVRRLSQTLHEVDSGARDHLIASDAATVLDSTPFRGPIPQSHEELIVHRWRAPFTSYFVRLHVDAEGVVDSYDTLSEIPKSVVAALPQRQRSPEELKYIERAQINRVADEMVDAINVPPAESIDPTALDRIREKLSSLSSELIPKNSATITEPQLAKRRTEWYRKLWVESYEKYSAKHAAWEETAKSFLEMAAEAVGKTGACSDVREHMQKSIAEMQTKNCRDPLVRAVMLQFTYDENDKHAQMPGEIVDAFIDSDYPANTAYLSGFPPMSAKDLIRLQARRAPAGEKPDCNLLDVTDPVDARILYRRLCEILSNSFQADLYDSNYRKKPSQATILAATQNPTPWFRFMLAGLHATKNYDLKAARDCYCNAWNVCPEIPEAPGHLFRTDFLLFVDTGEPYNSYAGEQRNFWFRQSLDAQFDYIDAYNVYESDLHLMSGGSHETMMRYAQQCLQTGRTDTAVPLRFLNVLIKERDYQHFCHAAPEFIQGQVYFGTEEVYDSLKILVQGYTGHEELPILKSYLACSSYMLGHVDEAALLLEELNYHLDESAVSKCNVTASEIFQSSKMSKRPFLLSPHAKVSQLEFVNNAESLMFTDRQGKLYRMQISTGNVEHIESLDEHIRLIMAVKDESGKLLVCSEEKGPSLRDLQSLDTLNEISIPRQNGQYFLPKQDGGVWCTTRVSDGALVVSLYHPVTGELLGSISPECRDASNVDAVAQKHLVAFIAVSNRTDSTKEQAIAQVWDWQLKMPLISVQQPFTGSIDDIAISQSGELVALSGSRHGEYWDTGGVRALESLVVVIDLDSKNTLTTLEHPASVSCMHFYKSHELLITGCDDGIIRLWNPLTGKLLSKLAGHSGAVSSLAFNPEKNLLASGASDGRIHIWHIDSSEVQVRTDILTQPLHNLTHIQIDPVTNDILTQSRDERGVRWRADSNYQEHEQVVSGDWSWTTDGKGFIVSTDNSRVIQETGEGQTTATIEAYEAGRSTPIQTFEVASSERVTGVVTPDGKSLITTGNVCTVWSLESGEPWPWGQLIGPRGTVNNLSISSDGRRLMTWCTRPEPEICIWEMPQDPRASDATARLRIQWKPTIQPSNLTAIMSPIGNLFLLPYANGKLQVRNIDTGDRVGEIDGRSPAISPNGALIAVADGASTIKIYDSTTLMLQRTVTVSEAQPNALQWGSDNRSLFYTNNDWIYGIDTETSKDLLGRILIPQ